jgi:very-short-patch-repair endonuclease
VRDVTAIYLADKISRHDWRHDLVGNDISVLEASDDWPDLPMAQFPGLVYVGPYFCSGAGHGLTHVPNAHGFVEGIYGASPTQRPDDRQLVLEGRCLDALRRADLVFAWLDDTTAYGTLVEIGYAKALGKTIVIGIAKGFDASDLWFAVGLAEWMLPEAISPAVALRMFVDNVMPPQLESPIEVAFWQEYQRRLPVTLTGLTPQVPALDRYRLDFGIADRKFGIELDGYDFHSSPDQFTADRARQRALELDGWRIIRFTGREIHRDVTRCVTEAAAFAERL